MDLLVVDGDDACGTSVVACLKSGAGKKGSASTRKSGSMKGSFGQWGIAETTIAPACCSDAFCRARGNDKEVRKM